MIYANLSTMIFHALHGQNASSSNGEIEIIQDRLDKRGKNQDGAVGIIREALKAIEVRKLNDLPGEIANRARLRPDQESHVATLDKDWIAASDMTPFEKVVAAAHDIRRARVEDSGSNYLVDLEELRLSILEEAEEMGIDMEELELIAEEPAEDNQDQLICSRG